MKIISVIPRQDGDNAPTSTVIHAQDANGHHIPFAYSHAYELIHDPNKPYCWLGWNGGTLTEAIAYIIGLDAPGNTKRYQLSNTNTTFKRFLDSQFIGETACRYEESEDGKCLFVWLYCDQDLIDLGTAYGQHIAVNQ